MFAKQVGGVVTLGIVALASVGWASTGTTFEGTTSFITGAAFTLAFWMGMVGLLGLIMWFFQLHFSPMVLGGIIGTLFVCAMVASHSSLMGMVGLAAAATLH